MPSYIGRGRVVALNVKDTLVIVRVITTARRWKWRWRERSGLCDHDDVGDCSDRLKGLMLISE